MVPFGDAESLQSPLSCRVGQWQFANAGEVQRATNHTAPSIWLHCVKENRLHETLRRASQLLWMSTYFGVLWAINKPCWPTWKWWASLVSTGSGYVSEQENPWNLGNNIGYIIL